MQATSGLCAALELNPPADFLEALQVADGGEGFIGQSYFRLYSVDEMRSLNEAYQVNRFAPGLVIFGSNGGGDAFGFDTRKEPIKIVQVPFIPMDFQYAKPFGSTFMGFLHALAEADKDNATSVPQINMSAVGKEVHEIHPIVFGGSPTDDKNKALVPSEKHAELSVFWNRVYQEKVYGRKF